MKRFAMAIGLMAIGIACYALVVWVARVAYRSSFPPAEKCERMMSGETLIVTVCRGN